MHAAIMQLKMIHLRKTDMCVLDGQ